MTAVIVLAVYAVSAVGGMAAMKTKLAEHFGSETAAISVLPISFGGNGITAYAWMPILSLGRVPRRAVVGGVVSRRRAGRRRVRRAANLLGADRARRRAGDARRSSRALRASSVAVDHHRARDGDSVSERHRAESRSRGRVRPGVRRPAPDAVARLHDGRFRRGVHVHRGDAAQLGRVVSRERRLSPIPEEGRDREALRRRVAPARRSSCSCCRRSSRGSCRRSKARGNSCWRSAPERASC